MAERPTAPGPTAPAPVAPTPARYDAVDSLVGLAATLRGMGVQASTDRVHAAVRDEEPPFDPATSREWLARFRRRRG